LPDLFSSLFPVEKDAEVARLKLPKERGLTRTVAPPFCKSSIHNNAGGSEEFGERWSCGLGLFKMIVAGGTHDRYPASYMDQVHLL